MKGNGAHLSANERSSQVATLVDEIILHWSHTFEMPDVDGLKKKHAELMPELGEALDRTMWIFEAEQKARAMPTEHPDLIPVDGFPGLREALGAYDIHEQIHYGGQGVVYRAIQLATEREVALKIFLGNMHATPQERVRFERESQLISRLNHPNIVTLYEAGVAASRLYYAMEYVDGVNVEDHVLMYDLNVREIVELFVKICRAVNAAHQHGIIHRDLHPANIIVDEDGEPHLLDFGLAKDAAEPPDSRVSQPHLVMGVLKYMSPEHVGAGDAQTDVFSDVYGLGVILYQLLTETFPYDVTGEFGFVREQIVNREPTPLLQAFRTADPERRATLRDANRDLEAIVQRALAKDKSARYRSAAELGDDLERFLTGEAVSARAKNRGYMLRKTLRRNWMPLSGVAIVVVALATSAAVSRYSLGNAREATKGAVAEVDRVFQIVDSVTHMLGGARLSDAVLREMAQALPALAERIAADSEFREIGVRLEELQGDVSLALGEVAKASVHYNRFLDGTLELWHDDPETAVLAASVFRAFGKRAKVAAELGEDPRSYYEGAQTFLQDAGARFSDEQPVSFERCALEGWFGEYLHKRGTNALALEHLNNAAGLAREQLDRTGTRAEQSAGESEWPRLAATVLSLRGEILDEEGNSNEAFSDLMHARKIRQTYLEENSADARTRRDQVIGLTHIASHHLYQTDRPGAMELLQEAIRHAALLHEIEPSVKEWATLLLTARTRLMRLHVAEEDFASAEDESDRAREIYQRIQHRFGSDMQMLRLFAGAEVARAESLAKQKQHLDAVRAFESSIETITQIVANDPEDNRTRQQLSNACQWLARSRVKIGDVDGAVTAAADAVEPARRAHEREPDSTLRSLGLVAALGNLCAIQTIAAENHAKQVTAGPPEFVYIHVTRSMAYLDLARGTLNQATRLLNRTPSTIDSDNMRAQRSLCQDGLARNQRAIESVWKRAGNQ